MPPEEKIKTYTSDSDFDPREYKCHDCGKDIELEEKKIINGVLATYSAGTGDKVTVFKCSECFIKDDALRDFQECEVYSRVAGFYRPVKNWHKGKQEEFKDRKEYL